jgi:hypothetical protein
MPGDQMDEPFIHSVPARGKAFGKLDVDDLVETFNNTRRGCAPKRRSGAAPMGNGCQQNLDPSAKLSAYAEALNEVDADALTFPAAPGGNRAAIGSKSRTRRSSSALLIIVHCR